MSQTWTDDTYAGGHTAATDLQNIENNFAALKSSFSGAALPANAVDGTIWKDTGKKTWKGYNGASSFGFMHGDANQKIWIYRDTAMDGWVVDTSVTDRVLAIKGGYNAYNISGGSLGGTWTQPSHTLTISEIPSHAHRMAGYTAGNVDLGGSGGLLHYGGTLNTDSVGGGGAHSHGGTTYRPAAAVGTLQYLDL